LATDHLVVESFRRARGSAGMAGEGNSRPSVSCMFPPKEDTSKGLTYWSFAFVGTWLDIKMSLSMTKTIQSVSPHQPSNTALTRVGHRNRSLRLLAADIEARQVRTSRPRTLRQKRHHALVHHAPSPRHGYYILVFILTTPTLRDSAKSSLASQQSALHKIAADGVSLDMVLHTECALLGCVAGLVL
jgi:hypothetical protein